MRSAVRVTREQRWGAVAILALIRGNPIALAAAAILILAANVGRATIVEPRDLDELVGEAEYVGSVWIEQSTSLSPDPTLKYPACGASYTARTVDVVKGVTGTVRFYASEELVVGREYLVLLARGLRSTTALISTTSLSGTSPPAAGKQKYLEDCSKRYPGSWSMEGAAAPLLDRRVKFVKEGYAGERWVRQPYFLRDIRTVAQLDADMLDTVLSMSPTTPYPSGTYLSWKGVRDALLQAVVRTTPGKAPERIRAK